MYVTVLWRKVESDQGKMEEKKTGEDQDQENDDLQHQQHIQHNAGRIQLSTRAPSEGLGIQLSTRAPSEGLVVNTASHHSSPSPQGEVP